jgi:SH3-like domain-containing protein
MMGNYKRLGSAAAGIACIAIGIGTAWPVFSERGDAAVAGAVTGSVEDAPKTLGPSGFPLPRFVSLKSDKVNVRRGPSSEHKVAWVFERKGMPVEITAEFENWRRIRDSDGQEGWILQNMLSGKRMAAVAPWKPGNVIGLHAHGSAGSGLIARLEAGAVGDIETCTGEWCLVSIGGFEGYIEQAMIWGAYPGETVND